MYGIMIVLGITACVFISFKLTKQRNINRYDFFIIMIFTSLFIATGASLLYALTNIRFVIILMNNISSAKPKEIAIALKNIFGGFVFYGGFIGGYIGIITCTKISKNQKTKTKDILDIYAVLTPLFHTFGRIGCFFAGCCYGIESPIGFTAHNNHLIPYVNDVQRLPIQLIESACNVIIFIILLKLFYKPNLRHKLIYIYMLIYPAIRLITETFRDDTYRGFLFGLSTSQWISILLISFAVITLLKKKYHEKTNTKTPQTERGV